MQRRQQHKTDQFADAEELKVPSAKPRLVQWSHKPEWWRLRGAILGLTRANRESIELLRVVRQERIDRESRELSRQCQDLITDAALVGDDREAVRRLSVRIAIFYQRVGALEETVESLLHEHEADVQAE